MNAAEHPIVQAREQARRGDPAALATMRDVIARSFGIMVDHHRLEPDESAGLLALHKKATAHEEWEAAGVAHYGLTSRLSKAEQARWRSLVSKAAGREGLLDDLDDDGRVAAKIARLVKRALQPAPSSMLAPEGAAVLPAAVLDDVIRGKLVGVDVAVLGVVVATIASGKLHPRVEQLRDVRWGDDGTLVVRHTGLHRLLPVWDTEDGLNYGQDRIDLSHQRIEQRLHEAGWLSIERSGGELHVRLGERLLEAGGQ